MTRSAGYVIIAYGRMPREAAVTLEDRRAVPDPIENADPDR